MVRVTEENSCLRLYQLIEGWNETRLGSVSNRSEVVQRILTFNLGLGLGLGLGSGLAM